MITVLGVLILCMAWSMNHSSVRFTPNRVLVVMGLNAIVLMGTGVITTAIFGHSNPDMTIIKGITMWQVILAGFEDAVFVLPALMMEGDERYVWLLFSSILFTSCHAYQGYADMFAKVFMIPLVYVMAKRWGILTTMVAHSLLDMVAITLLKLSS